MMDALFVHGPACLRGSVRASGAKNAALPALAASLLTDAPLTLRSVPDVTDVHVMLGLLADLGVSGARSGDALRLHAVRGPASGRLPPEEMGRMRAGVLAVGPLLARRGRVVVPRPGGCSIGARPIDQHLAGFEAMGATVSIGRERIVATAPPGGLRGAWFHFALPTVTGTENLLLAAVLAQGRTVLENCAREPEVVNLASLLGAMGAHVAGAGTPVIRVEGVPSLRGALHTVMPDRIESGTYLIGAAATGGDVTVTDAPVAALDPLLERLEAAGAEVDVRGPSVRVRAASLRAVDVATGPYPGFPTDLQAPWTVLATQASGRSRIRETIFDGRFGHVPELLRLGASIDVQGRELWVEGRSRLRASEVTGTELRGTAALVLAALAARGTTCVRGVEHLDRGYEGMEAKLRSLGARVSRGPSCPWEPATSYAPPARSACVPPL